MENLTEVLCTIRDVLRWEGRVLRRAWYDTWSWLRGLGLWWDLAFITVPPIAIWFLRDSTMTAADVLWAVGVGWGTVIIILLLRGVWNYIWTPFRQDRELREEIKELSQEKERSVNLSAHSPRKEDAVFLDVINLEASEEMKLAVTWFGGAPAGLITPYSLPWKDQKGEYRHVPKHTPERIRLCGFKLHRGPSAKKNPPTIIFIYERAGAEPVEQEVQLSDFFSNKPDEYWGDAGFRIAAISKTRGLLDQFLVVLRVKAIMGKPERVLLETTVSHARSKDTSSRGAKVLYHDGVVNR